jgi:hypothetical protein
MRQDQQESKGALIGTIIVIIILIAGAVYVLANRNGINQQGVTATSTEVTTTETVDTAGTSTDINSIEQDLKGVDNNSDLNNLDKNLGV